MPLHRRLPKRGFTNIFKKDFTVVNVEQLESRFEKDTVVDPDRLRAARLLQGKGKPLVKILGRGEITRPLHVKVHGISATARKKIEAAGGKVELL